MKRRLALLAAVASIAVGVIVMNAGPVAASSTGLGCNPDTRLCTAYDSDGLRTVNFRAGGDISYAFDCTTNPKTTSFDFYDNATSNVKVYITDCNTPRQKATFIIHNGDMKVVQVNNS